MQRAGDGVNCRYPIAIDRRINKYMALLQSTGRRAGQGVAGQSYPGCALHLSYFES